MLSTVLIIISISVIENNTHGPDNLVHCRALYRESFNRNGIRIETHKVCSAENYQLWLKGQCCDDQSRLSTGHGIGV